MWLRFFKVQSWIYGCGNNCFVQAFTCGICSIGFTKRNNAARHIQHQHNVSRKSAHFHQLIIRNFDADVGKDEVSED